MADAKLILKIVGGILGGLVGLLTFPLIIYGTFLYIRQIYSQMIGDRKKYLRNEEKRKKWNEAARREKILRYRAEALIDALAKKNGADPDAMRVLVRCCRCRSFAPSMC